MGRRTAPLPPLSSDADHIARSLDFAAKDITTFAADERMSSHTFSRDFCTEQASYYGAMAADWRKLAERLREVGC